MNCRPIDEDGHVEFSPMNMSYEAYDSLKHEAEELVELFGIIGWQEYK